MSISMKNGKFRTTAFDTLMINDETALHRVAVVYFIKVSKS